MSKKHEFDYRKVEKQAIAEGLRYHAVIILVVVIGLIGFTLLRVSNLTAAKIDQEYVDDKTAELKRVNFNLDAIDKIKNLKDSGIDIDPNTSDRDNPFNE